MLVLRYVYNFAMLCSIKDNIEKFPKVENDIEWNVQNLLNSGNSPEENFDKKFCKDKYGKPYVC
jgi:hypothetical protein